MAVTTTTNKISYTSTGGTTFAYDFKILQDSDLLVYHDGVLQTTGYSVTGAGNDAGGTVVHTSAVPAGVKVLLVRSVPQTQLITIPGGASKFPTESVEDGLDKLTMLVQQNNESLSRSLKWPLTVPSTVSDILPDPTLAANKGGALVIASDGLSIETHAIDGAGDIDVLTSAGDMVIHTGSSVARLAMGGNRSVLVRDGSSGLPSWKENPTYWAAQGNVPTDGTDAYLALQTILNTIGSLGGGTLELEHNTTYAITQALVMYSKTRIIGNGATIKAHASFSGTNAANTCYLLRNLNHGHNNIPTTISALTDEDIYIEGIHFDYNGKVIAGGGAHCISMRYVDKVTVVNCTCTGDGTDTENLTAFLACRDTVTAGCHAVNTRNCAFDHWDGAGNAVVAYCSVRITAGTAAQGIQFTGTGTNGENRTSTEFLAIGNYVKGVKNVTASALLFNANDADSAVYHARSIGNYIEDCDLGVVFSGAGGHGFSLNDTLKDVLVVPLFAQTADSDSPGYVAFYNPTLIDCDHEAGTPGLIALGGQGHIAKGIRVINTGAVLYEYIVWLASQAVDCQVQIDYADDGNTGRVNNQGTNCRVLGENVAYTPHLVFGAGSNDDVAYNSRAGGYTINGDVVEFWGRMDVSGNGTDTGSATVTLPLTASSAYVVPGMVQVKMTGAVSLAGAPLGSIATSGTTFSLAVHNSTGTAALTDTNIVASTVVDFHGTYRINRIQA